MPNWDNFYTLIGGTAGTLIGLIFVVVSVGADRVKAGDEDRTRIVVTPVLVHFASLLADCSSHAGAAFELMRAPCPRPDRMRRVGLCGQILRCSPQKRIKAEEREPLWVALLPIAAYVCLLVSAAAWALSAIFRRMIGAIASVILLAAALRNSWAITLTIMGRPELKNAARAAFLSAI